MPERKRKASSALDSRPKKVQQTTSIASAQQVQGSEILKPIIATAAGAFFPQDVKFQPFLTKTDYGPQILIHSSDHPTIDYTGVEGTESAGSCLRHYVAVHDPATNKLKVTEAIRLTVRGAIRQGPRLEQSDDDDTANFMTLQGTRAALTETFGSKKSKKAVQSMAENRQLGQGVEGATIADVITYHMPDEEDDGGLSVDATARNNKPLPLPNLATDDIEGVYSISRLVHPSPAMDTLQRMPISPWKARMEAGKEVVGLRSRYVANRVTFVGKRVVEGNNPKYIQQFQLLRYIELLVEIAHYAGKQDRKRRMKFVDQWPDNTFTHGVSPIIVKSIVGHFFPDNTPNDRAMTFLRTTIFALTLHILPPSGETGGERLVAEPTDIQLDLALEAAEVRKLYHELGCKVSSATDKDLTTWGYTKLVERMRTKRNDGTTTLKPVFAVLKFPLDFPKMRTGRRQRK